MTAPATAPRKLALKDLRNYEDTLFVRNESMNALTCNTMDKTLAPFTLGPKGADDSVQVLPKHVAAQPGFQRAWLRGLVSISDDPEMEDELILQAEARVTNAAAASREIDAILEEPSSARSMVPGVCLISGETIFQTEDAIHHNEPPLAERFKGRAQEFVFTETIKDGRPAVVWTNPSDPSVKTQTVIAQ